MPEKERCKRIFSKEIIECHNPKYIAKLSGIVSVSELTVTTDNKIAILLKVAAELGWVIQKAITVIKKNREAPTNTYVEAEDNFKKPIKEGLKICIWSSIGSTSARFKNNIKHKTINP